MILRFVCANLHWKPTAEGPEYSAHLVPLITGERGEIAGVPVSVKTHGIELASLSPDFGHYFRLGDELAVEISDPVAD